MNDELIARRKAQVDAALRDRYTHEHVRALADAAAHRGTQRARRRLATAVGATLALGLAFSLRPWEERSAPPLSRSLARVAEHAAPTVARPTYSLEPIGTQAPRWTASESGDRALPRIRLDAGDVRVEVAERLRVDLSPPPGATFRDAAVEGNHAVFDLRWQRAAVVVASERGEVTVYVDGAVHRLAPGDHIVLGAGDTDATVIAATTSSKRRPDWKKLARAGDLEAARAALREARLRDPDDLMFAADTLRRAGHPGEAETHLRRVVEGHPDHVVAPVAAFTLGKLYLHRMNRPADAAKMFARVRSGTERGGALMEDALAREVESWAKAGQEGKARSLARTYVEQHPQGRHVSAMRRHLD